jgi:hypothetical protein
MYTEMWWLFGGCGGSVGDLRKKTQQFRVRIWRPPPAQSPEGNMTVYYKTNLRVGGVKTENYNLTATKQQCPKYIFKNV